MTKTRTPLEAANDIRNKDGQVVLVLQGGGALGAYQVGVYQALHEAGIVITQLLEYVPEKEKQDPLLKELAGYRCDTRMHVVRLLSPRLNNENHTKDIDFSPAGIRERCEAGYADTMSALWRQPWIGEFGLLDGVILHEPQPGAEPAAEIEPAKPRSGTVPSAVPKLAAE